MLKEDNGVVFDSQWHQIKEKVESKYLSLYPGQQTTLEALSRLMKRSYMRRSKTLIKRDKEGVSWTASGNTIGMMLYVDLFSGDLERLIEKAWYFEKVGVTLVHLMPLLEPRVGENDGGYAVKNYRAIDPKVGTMAQFDKLIKHYHQRGIRICIDYVINHTADDHEWALKAKAGDPSYQDYYFTYEDYAIPQAYENHLNEVFPKVAPGNFTYNQELGRWVMTTFYPYQWDLNYRNPVVFQEMVDTLLFFANKGVDMIRLDAIPYMWKVLGTNCRNLPEVHTLLSLFRDVLEICAPSTALLGEAIVQPDIIVKYFGQEGFEACHSLYNASYMVEIWNAIATRDARHMAEMPQFMLPKGATWINYARCHDDIGWGLNEDHIRHLGFDPGSHKSYLIDFYHGVLKDSFSVGELYEFNPVTMDARNSGTLASLAGLEKALASSDRYQLELSIKRIELIHALFMLRRGIPMIYSGDEMAKLNDYTYKNDPHKSHDSRWLHRSSYNWDDMTFLEGQNDYKALGFRAMQELVKLRQEVYGSCPIQHEIVIQLSNHHILGIKQIQCGEENEVILLFNCSEDRQWIYTAELRRHQLQGDWQDRLQGKTVSLLEDTILLGPYEFFLLQKRKKSLQL
jgi:glycosidase